jgi:hypothetical protein
LQEPPKFTQIGISGLKICRLATLAQTTWENYEKQTNSDDRWIFPRRNGGRGIPNDSYAHWFCMIRPGVLILKNVLILNRWDMLILSLRYEINVF